MQKKNLFLAKRPEDSKLNQYWFSQQTIETLVQHITQKAQEFEIQNQRPMQMAFISTPSVFCSMPKELKANSALLEFDQKFKVEAGFVFYDFNKPLELDPTLEGRFDFTLIDPPFITLEVWSKYASTAKFLLKPEGKLLLCSIVENEKMLNDLLSVKQRLFKPSIPKLIYQYNFYSNYDDPLLDSVNPEVGY